MIKQKKSLVCAFRAAVIFTLLPVGVNFVRAQAAAPPTDVPVTEVTLFSSGVGYFQHDGKVSGDGEARLNFKTAQINDILKSLILQDLDGGHVGVVTYPSQDPLEKTLASFQVNLSDNPGMAELLNKLRGARVSFPGTKFPPGTILGVEKRQVPGGAVGQMPLENAFLNLVTEDGIKSMQLDYLNPIKLDDPALQDELNRALAAVAGARDQDKKPVEIHFNGTGERRVRLGYVVETPVWKASYRLVLPDDKTATVDKDAKGTLQGWAIVDNQTDNDWNNVKLSLVSGRPISFRQDLYGPLYVPRPLVVPEEYASLQPPVYEGADQTGEVGHDVSAMKAVPQFRARRALSEQSAGLAVLNTAQNIPAAPMPAVPAGPPSDFFGASIQSIAETAQMGELFQYTVGDVSLARQRSAMIPILNDPVRVDKLSIYNESTLAKHPLNGVRLHNNTPDKKHLLQGPVTVFDGGGYAGDARLDDVPPGETRLLSYGVDLQTEAKARSLDNQQAIQTGKIVKGVLELTRKIVSAKEYTLDNKSDHDKNYVVEHPLRLGWGLVDTPAPYQTTDKAYRFALTAPAGKQATLTVHEENIQSQTVELVSSKLEDTQFYSRTGEIPAPVREALAKAAALKHDVADSQTQIADREGQIKALASDQARIRDNLKTVGKGSDFGARQLKKLDDQESQIDRLRTEIEALRTKLDGQQHALDEYLAGLNVG